MQKDSANSSSNLSSLDNIAKLAPIFTVLILATSIIYDSAYLFALGLSFTDIPSSISEHVRSAILWSPIVFILLFFINTLYMADIFEIKNIPEEKTSRNNKLIYLIILIVVVAITGYQSFYLDNKQYTFIGLIFIWAILLMQFLDRRKEKKLKTTPLVILLLCLPIFLGLTGCVGYYYGDKLIENKTIKWEYTIKKEDKEVAFGVLGQRRFTEFTIAIVKDGKIIIIPNSNIVSTKSL